MTECKNCHYESKEVICPVCQMPLKKRGELPKINWKKIANIKNTFILLSLLGCWVALDIINPEVMNKTIELPQRVVIVLMIVLYALKGV